MSRKFRHRKMYDIWKNKLRVNCSCGELSPVFMDTELLTAREQAEEWYLNHTGLRERQLRGV